MFSTSEISEFDADHCHKKPVEKVIIKISVNSTDESWNTGNSQNLMFIKCNNLTVVVTK
jgi:hypothetical protein